MFCGELFTPGHQLKQKRAQVFFMECEDEDLSESEDGSVEMIVEESGEDSTDK